MVAANPDLVARLKAARPEARRSGDSLAPRQATAEKPPAKARRTKPATASATPPVPEPDRGQPRALALPEIPASARAPRDRQKGSQVPLPADLHARVCEYRDAHGLTTGEVVIQALEAAAAHPEGLLASDERVGGKAFRPMSTRAAAIRSKPDLPMKHLNYRLRESDFPVMDQLRYDLGARSRTELLWRALERMLPAPRTSTRAKKGTR